MLSVNAASGVHSYKDFIAHGYKAANPLTYSSSGVGSSGHLVGESFAQKAGIKTGDVITALGEHKITSLEAYMQALGKYKKGDKVGVTFTRGSQTLSSTVEF